MIFCVSGRNSDNHVAKDYHMDRYSVCLTNMDITIILPKYFNWTGCNFTLHQRKNVSLMGDNQF